MNSHELAHALLQKPAQPVWVKTGANSRDVPSYGEITGIRTFAPGDLDKDLVDFVEEDSVVVLRVVEVGGDEDGGFFEF
jgi:hypothetical protein